MKIKILLPLMLLVAVAVTAFAMSSHADSKTAKRASWYYFSINPDGTLGSYVGLKTEAEARVSGCAGGSGTPCRRGYSSSQLANPSVPSAGPSDMDSYSDNINRP